MLKLPPPLWALLLLTGFYFATELPVLNALPLLRNRIAGDALIVAGLLLPLIAMAQFFAARTQILPTSEKNDKLVVRGLYHFTRNPMYLGMVIASLGAALWFGRLPMFLAPVLMFTIANRVFIPFEEAKMRRQFGAEFDAYTKRVRRWV